ncbi:MULTISPECIES: diacylglycerol kinase [Vibrio]|uniref:Diacylglycerol kinase n=1 Tax=Vibrio cortegadensis TaxID=1328770 RepID=A0ABV4M8V1_9VIBR|nr:MULTISPECIES: diacylglycerol kinase [Vibrio]MDN3695858.1 diacylglycerol kinase [Vibrio cortegadensis]NOH85726.1 diacylglycerol kinase [Vibrio sp. 03-59-1]RBW63751.1 diacylglycerol kinase [Vibrionales bacterium C3R12]
MKPGKTGIARIYDATGYSMKGLKAAWINEAAFRQEVVLCFLLTIATFVFTITDVERVVLIGSLVLILLAELLNSAIEAVVDRIGSEWHELSGRAKDIGSAAVFVSLVFAALTWAIILL